MPLKYKFFLLALFALAHFNILKGNSSIDSIVSERHLDARVIENLIHENKQSNLELKIIEITGVIKQARLQNKKKKAEDLTLLLGELYMETGQYDASIALLEELKNATKDDTLKLKIYYNKASVYGKRMKYDEAINELLSLRNLNRKVGNKEIEAYALNQIGVIYAMQKSMDIAQKYIYESLEISREINNYTCMANAYSNLASFCSKEDSAFRQYLSYSHSALHYYKLVDNKNYLLSIYNDMITRFWEKQMQDSVDAYLNKIYELMPQVDFPEEIARTAVNLFLIGEITNDSTIRKMFDWFSQNGYLNNNLEVTISYYFFYYRLEYLHGNYEKALSYFEDYKSATDSLYMRHNTDKISIIEKNYELEKSSDEMERRDQRRVFIGIIMLLLLLLLGVILALLIKRHRSKIKEASHVQTSLQSRLEEKNKELVSNLMQLIKVKETNNKMIDYLNENKQSIEQKSQWLIENMISNLKETANDDFWTEFNLRFKDVNQEFYDKLNDQHPDLTVNERRICAFLFLDMSTKEIANITGQSLNSINLARTRLRKKLGLTSHKTSINAVLQNL